MLRKQTSLLIALLVTVAFAASACAPVTILMGEGGVPGYPAHPVPEQHRGKTNPFSPDDAQAVQAGQGIYLGRCLRCHGEDGQGNGPQAPFLEPQPANFAAPMVMRAFEQHQDYLFALVSEGKAQTGMPAFKDDLSETEIWQVITYAWALGRQAGQPR